MARSVSQARRKPDPLPDRGNLLTPREACDLMRVSYRTLKRMVSEGRLFYTTLPGSTRWRFYENDIRAALEANRRETVTS